MNNPFINENDLEKLDEFGRKLSDLSSATKIFQKALEDCTAAYLELPDPLQRLIAVSILEADKKWYDMAADERKRLITNCGKID